MIKPMLAYKVDKKPVDWSENVYIQPKLDGVRCVIYLGPVDRFFVYFVCEHWFNHNLSILFWIDLILFSNVAAFLYSSAFTYLF